MPSGKFDQGEPLAVGAAHELFEEPGVSVEPAELTPVQVVHHRQDDHVERIGFFFEALIWQGEPIKREPVRHRTRVRRS
ncbi:hypothetical protein [Streptomyces sp. IBSBF 3136]|uniref:hypothetical protein n=1 Tax=Streptomyces sp. IBSBF 3136 TaxID=2903524 RepID=UPI002FDBCE1A